MLYQRLRVFVLFLIPKVYNLGTAIWIEHDMLRLVQNLYLLYFSFQPVLHDWCNKGCGMCYPVCGMMHIKEPLLLIEKSIPYSYIFTDWQQ